MAGKVSANRKTGNLTEFTLPTPEKIPMEARIEQIPTESTLTPNMPMGLFLQEAYNIHIYMQDDREKLFSTGLNPALAEELPLRISCCRDAEARSWSIRYGESPVKREWQRLKTLAEKTVGELLHGLAFISPDDEYLVHQLKLLRKNNDTVSVCDHLAALMKTYRQPLSAVGIPRNTFTDLITCSNGLLKATAVYEIEKRDTPYILSRNKAYTFVYVALEEIRRHARFALSNDRKRLRGYASEYFRKSSRRKSVNENKTDI